MFNARQIYICHICDEVNSLLGTYQNIIMLGRQPVILFREGILG